MFKPYMQEALIAGTIIFDSDASEPVATRIMPGLSNVFVDVVSLDGLGGSPVTPTAGSYSIYYQDTIDGGYKEVPNNSSLNATLTGGTGLADGVQTGLFFSGNPLKIKVVPNGVDVATAYRVDVKQGNIGKRQTTQRWIELQYSCNQMQVPVSMDPEVVVFDVPDVISPLATVSGGEVTFNYDGQMRGHIFVSPNRTSGGQEETIKFWFQVRVATGPDVWINVPGSPSTNKRVEQNAVDFAEIAIGVSDVTYGLTFRMLMQVSSSANGIGLYSTPATAEAPLVNSSAIRLELMPDL